MSLNPAIFKAYDIRGIYPTELDEEGIKSIVQAIYSFLLKDLGKEQLSVALGHDMRTSSPALFNAALEALTQTGAAVTDIGLVSTPTLYFSVLSRQFDVGIQISASHNPKEYNGVKIVKREGNRLIKIGKTTGMDEIKKMALEGSFAGGGEPTHAQKYNTAVQDEVQSALTNLTPKNIKKLKVVADTANAMGAVYLEELSKHVPMELVKMNFELDGTFPVHQPDPLQFDNLKDLQKKVLEEKADLGIAPDGDGDRVFFIDEKGQILQPTMITSLIASEILKKKSKEKIVVDIRYIRNVINVCQKYPDSEVIISPVGHAFITELVNKRGAAFAGESSAHYYFRETGGAESAVYVILYLLEMLGKENKTVSQLLTPFHSYFESSEFNFELPPGTDSNTILEKIKTDYSDGEANLLDGLSIDYPNWRMNIRTSNTEPLLRLNLEADKQTLMQQKLDEVLQKLQAQGAVRK